MIRRLLLAIIMFYRRWISPAKRPSCRFYPTCSAYALESIRRFGALRGGYLALVRLLKCNPYHRGGLDPVPEAWEARKRLFRIRRGGDDD